MTNVTVLKFENNARQAETVLGQAQLLLSLAKNERVIFKIWLYNIHIFIFFRLCLRANIVEMSVKIRR